LETFFLVDLGNLVVSKLFLALVGPPLIFLKKVPGGINNWLVGMGFH